MADSVTVTPGVGATIACDEVDGVLFQQVKIVSGLDGEVDVATELGASVYDRSVCDVLGAILVELKALREIITGAL